MNIRICTDHSTKHTEKTQAIDLKLMGGSPYFAYIWIDDVCYTIRRTYRSKSFKIEKTK